MEILYPTFLLLISISICQIMNHFVLLLIKFLVKKGNCMYRKPLDPQGLHLRYGKIQGAG